MLAWTVYITFIGVALLMVLPKDDARLARATALFTALIGLLIGFAGVMFYKPDSGIVDVASEAWIPSLGIRYHLAVDGVSLVLVLLTGIAAVVGILFSW